MMTNRYGVLTKWWHACGWSTGGMTCVWSIGGTVTDLWSIGGVMTFVCCLWKVDIMCVEWWNYDVCNVGGMMTCVWAIGGVIACTWGEVEWLCVRGTGGVKNHMRKWKWGRQGKQVPPKGKLNWNKNCIDQLFWCMGPNNPAVLRMIHLFC
jgi:hypothetical protein